MKRHPAIGMVGLGVRGLLNLATKIAEGPDRLGLRIDAVCDPEPERLQSGIRHLAAHGAGEVKAYTSAAELAADPDIDVVMVTTPQDAHEEPFAQAAEAGKIVYCEKPLAASPDACERMRRAVEKHRPRCVFGLTRRYENSWRTAHQMVADGAIGAVQMVMLRSIIPYDVYFHRWHRRTAWSGGLLNEKSAHHFDMLNWFAGSAAEAVAGVGGRRVFAPRPGYPARCRDCERDCAYRVKPPGTPKAQDAQATMATTSDDPRRWNDRCVYSEEADIIDHAAVTVQYANGVVGTLAIAIFGPQSPDQETLEIVGESGRIILTRHTGELDVVAGHGAERQIVDARDGRHDTSHFGADYRLLESLGAVAAGDQVAVAGFEDAYAASMMAFAAQSSLERGGVPTAVAVS